jgi:2,3-bisphosphoglycerate-independent phosphoglycerate mutase
MAKEKAKKVILVIIDGWGVGPKDDEGNFDKFNAIENADTANYDRLIREYPNVSLKSDGKSVGLPEGQTGTSEVNHLTIGAGRVILQTLPKINHAIETGEFFSNQAINATIDHVADMAKEKRHKDPALHLAGILSDGGVHSSIKHVFALLDLLKKRNFSQPVYFHLFTDGRDVAPKSAYKYIEQLEEKMKETGIGSIATIQGRFFLDRDRDWDKTEKAFQLIANGKGIKASKASAAVNLAYNQVNSDEYMEQYVIDEDASLKPGDGLIFFHYRTDRIYQILHRMIEEKLDDFSLTSFVQPSDEFTELKVAFPKPDVTNTLAEVISKAGLKQLHITETEKYPHLTYFLNGQRESEFPREEWIMHESNRFVKPRYNFEPSMQNYKITNSIIKAVLSDDYDFVVTNLSSPDMVGHTGNYSAAVISAESIDYCLGKIYEAIEDKLDEYALIVTADHGNSEEMWDYENDQPHTQHTLNKVPLILVSDINCKLTRRESLEDIAPTILELLGLPKPSIMTGESLIDRK